MQNLNKLFMKTKDHSTQVFLFNKTQDLQKLNTCDAPKCESVTTNHRLHTMTAHTTFALMKNGRAATVMTE